LAIFLIGGLAVAAAVNLVLGLMEVRRLRALLVQVVGAPRITTREQLVQLQKWLTTRIRWVRGTERQRPFLRHSATRILATGKGFCGENARVATLLLNVGGLPARRLYLEGPRWGHVLVEHRWGAEWVAFDAHADPGVMLRPEALGRVPSDRIDLLPNDYNATNPWLRAYRIGLAHRLSALRRFEQARVPMVVSMIAESPYFIRAFLTAALAGALMPAFVR
jgi:hypothetical protein